MEDAAERWRSQTLAYVAEVNAYVHRGTTEGWDSAGAEPSDPRDEALAHAVVDLVRRENEDGDWRSLRQTLPTAHRPFVSMLDGRCQSISGVSFLDERRVLARIGEYYGQPRVAVFDLDGGVEELDAQACGVSPNRRFVALLHGSEVAVHEGMGGPVVSRHALPRADVGLGAPLDALGDEGQLDAVQFVLPSQDGIRVVVGASNGVFLLGAGATVRLLPTAERLRSHVGYIQKDGRDPSLPHLDMLHAAFSPDTRWVLLGSQSGQHLVMDFRGKAVAAFGPVGSEYPHHVAVSPDGEWAIFNSCHFYNGSTVKVRADHIDDLYSAAYKDHRHVKTLMDGPRVYASSFHEGAFLLGDAHGYCTAVDVQTDEIRWRHFVGSSASGMDVSPDGKTLAFGTHAGFLSLIDLTADEPDPAVIGTGGHREILRFVAWKGEPIWRW